MSFASDLIAEPWRFDFFTVLRHHERSTPARPRIGDNAATAEAVLRLSQDPYLEFPASNLSGATLLPDGRLRVTARFLGMFGPQGALPLATTEESFLWLEARDDAFPRFVDLVQSRFIELFFRAWADARPIVQRDRPETDRFAAYIGSMVGIGTPPFRRADSLPDDAKLDYAGLVAPQVKSASRLKSLIAGLFDVRVEIEQFVGSWLTFEASEMSRLGQRQASLGADCILGASMYSVQDKIRLRVYVRDFAQYQRFLPVGDLAEPLADAVFHYLGDQTDWDIELAIPAGEVQAVRLGTGARLGWTTWSAPNWADTDRTYRTDTRFHLAERLARRRPAKSRPTPVGDRP